MRLLFILFITFSFSVFAQNTEELHTESSRAKKYYQKAQNEASRRNYKAAHELLDQAIQKDNKFGEAYYLKAVIFSNYGARDTSAYYYRKVLEYHPENKKFEKAHFYVALHDFEAGHYKEAKQGFQNFLHLVPKNAKFKKMAEDKIRNCEFALNPENFSYDIKPVKMDEVLNRFQYQYFPALTADQEFIFYTARDDVSTEDIFVSRKINGEWIKPQSVSSVINTPGFNEGTASISGDGRMLVFTSCNSPGGRGRCDLYISMRNGSNWSKPKNMGPNVNSKYWDSQPALSADGRYIYFSSDRPGGKGRMDIWVSRRDEQGRWTIARNVGAPINTRGEEFSPFLHPSNKVLYYATNGYDGFGGLDIFSSNKVDGEWSTPKNMGSPINSWKDEVAFYVSTDGKTAYFSTNEKDKSGNRSFLYSFDLPPELQLSEQSYSLKGIVYDKNTKRKLKADIDLINLENDEVEQSVSSDPINGDYLIVLTEGSDFGLFVSKQGYLFESINFNLKDRDSEGNVTLDIHLTPIELDARTVLNNIFFDFGKSSLRKESIPELEQLIEFLDVNPNVRIEIGGHTDNIGENTDNIVLSNERAKAVRDFLSKKNVPLSRLTFKGYGESKPIADNGSEEGRQKNRRIEFRILSK